MKYQTKGNIQKQTSTKERKTNGGAKTGTALRVIRPLGTPAQIEKLGWISNVMTNSTIVGVFIDFFFTVG